MERSNIATDIHLLSAHLYNALCASQEKYAAALRTISFMQTPARDSSAQPLTRSPEPHTQPLPRAFKTPSKRYETVVSSTTNQYRSPPTVGPTAGPMSASNDLMTDFMAAVAKVQATSLHIYVYVYMCMYRFMYTCTCICVCACVYVRIHVCRCASICISMLYDLCVAG